MSTMSPPRPGSEEFADYWSNKYVFNYCQVSAATACMYHALWTWPREIRCVWQRKLSIASYIFLVNRYATLCYNALGMVQLVSWGPFDQHTADTTCNIILTIADICTILTYLCLALFAALRTYAIWNKDRRVFAVVFGLGLIYPVGYTYFSLNIVYYATAPPVTGCAHYNRLPSWYNISRHLNAEELFYSLGITVNVIFEVVTIVLTWAKTLSTVRRLRGTNTSLVQNLSYVLLRDGTLHFVAILCTNGIPMLEFAYTPVRFVPPASETFTSILISNFILDLRKDYVARNGDRDTLLDASDLSDIEFAPQGSANSMRNEAPQQDGADG